MVYSTPKDQFKSSLSNLFKKEQEGDQWRRFIQSIQDLPSFDFDDDIEKYLPFSKLSLNRGTLPYHFVQNQIGSVYQLTHKTVSKSKAPWIEIAIECLIKSSMQATRLEEISYDIYLFLKEKKTLGSQNQPLESLAKRTIYLLYQLASLPSIDRLYYLNHQRIDQTLHLFVTHFTEYATNPTLKSSEEKLVPFDLKEALLFCRQLRLEFNQWALFEDRWQWLHNPEGQNNPLLLDTIKLQLPNAHLPCELVFSIDASSYEWIRLEPISMDYSITKTFTTDLPLCELMPKLSAYELFEDWKKNISQRFSIKNESTLYGAIDQLEGYFKDQELLKKQLENPLPIPNELSNSSKIGSERLNPPLTGIFQLCWLEIIRSISSTFTLRKKTQVKE